MRRSGGVCSRTIATTAAATLGAGGIHRIAGVPTVHRLFQEGSAAVATTRACWDAPATEADVRRRAATWAADHGAARRGRCVPRRHAVEPRTILAPRPARRRRAVHRRGGPWPAIGGGPAVGRPC